MTIFCEKDFCRPPETVTSREVSFCEESREVKRVLGTVHLKSLELVFSPDRPPLFIPAKDAGLVEH